MPLWSLVGLLLGFVVLGIGVNGLRIGKVLSKLIRGPAYLMRRTTFARRKSHANDRAAWHAVPQNGRCEL
jgi:hypothetical protein